MSLHLILTFVKQV